MAKRTTADRNVISGAPEMTSTNTDRFSMAVAAIANQINAPRTPVERYLRRLDTSKLDSADVKAIEAAARERKELRRGRTGFVLAGQS